MKTKRKTPPSPSSSASSTQTSDSKITTKSTTPEEFHHHLCHSIQNAKRRVKIASLYIGAGSGNANGNGNGGRVSSSSSSSNNSKSREDEFLYSLQRCATRQTAGVDDDDNDNDVEMTILMDASRAMRSVPIATTNTTNQHTSNSSSKNQVNKETSSIMTNSATEVYHSLFPQQTSVDNDDQTTTTNKERKKKGVYLFPVHDDGLLMRMVPSPFDEVLGVFHIKAYIVDDELLLSGANLSEEYFTDRQDRYISFVNGANGLVDFYSNLIDILSDYAEEYHPEPTNTTPTSTTTRELLRWKSSDAMTERRDQLARSLSELFDGSNTSQIGLDGAYVIDDVEEGDSTSCSNTTARTMMYAIPTFQAPPTFFQSTTTEQSHHQGQQQDESNNETTTRQLTILPDTHITRNILLALSEASASASSTTTSNTANNNHDIAVQISSAYLNPTPFLMSALERFRDVTLMTAAPISHGFAPKKAKTMETKANGTTTEGTKDVTKGDGGSSSGKGRGWIPSVFIQIAKEAAEKILPNGGKVMLYERKGWTFHAKGLWLTTTSSSHSAVTSNPSEEGNVGVEDGTSRSRGDGVDANAIHNDDNEAQKRTTTTDYDDSIMLASIVGSGNFGSRSEKLDFESNCILVVNPSYTKSSSSSRNKEEDIDPKSEETQQQQRPRRDEDPGALLVDEWKGMMAYSREIDRNESGVVPDDTVERSDDEVNASNDVIRSSWLALAVKVAKRYL